MTCLNTFHEKLDYKSCTQEMTADHLEELELVMNDFEKSTLMKFQGMDGAKFIVEEFSERKIINGVFYLQDLPTALKVAKDGDKICLKSGNYVLNKTTETVKKSVQIHGEGHDKTIITSFGMYLMPT